MEEIVEFLSQTFENQAFLKEIIYSSTALFLTSTVIFIASSYLYFQGKGEEENRFAEYKIAAEVAAYLMVFNTAWQFYNNHPLNGLVFIILGYFAFHFHSVCENLWIDEEIAWNSIPKEACISSIYPDRSSWSQLEKRYVKAKMNIRYIHDLETYSNMLDVPIDIFLTYQKGYQIEIKMSKNHPEVITFGTPNLKNKTILPDKLVESQTYISEY